MSNSNCIFCQDLEIFYEDDNWKVTFDKFPVSKGHCLIIPKRHCETYFDLNDIELEDLSFVIKTIKIYLDAKYHPDGYNIGCNCGEIAGQTVNHCHIHIIPRYKGDVANPEGGVRGVIPHKQHPELESNCF